MDGGEVPDEGEDWEDVVVSGDGDTKGGQELVFGYDRDGFIPALIMDVCVCVR